MVEPHAVLQVADGILHFGVAAMTGLEIEGVAVPVGDESVIAVIGEQRQSGAWGGLDPPDNETHRYGIGLTGEGNVVGFGHIGGTLHSVGDGRPVRFGYGLDDIPLAPVLADGGGEADIHLSADGDDGVGIEAAVGPHRELSRAPA